MQLLLDHLSATLIGGILLLTLVLVNFRHQNAALESTGNYALNRQMLDFTAVLQRDLKNVSQVETVAETDSTFIFFAQTSSADTTQYEIEYRRIQVDERDGMPLYVIERYVDDALTGSSMGIISEWTIQALETDGTPATTPAEARQIAVQVHMVMPFEITDEKEASSGLEETAWEATFRPALLQSLTL
jgi:hypothetical protein